MEAPNRRLVIVRHAKSDYPWGVGDHERPLAPRGRGDAPRVGSWIAGELGAPDLAVVSPAARTRQTWELLSPAFGTDVPMRLDDRIYGAWGDELVAVVAGLPAQARTVLLVGHEPGVSDLALLLADRGAGPGRSLRDRISEKYPTCTAAILTSGLDWDRAGPGWGVLVQVKSPRELPGGPVDQLD